MTIGVISDINHDSSPAYSSYFYACKNVFDNVKLVNNVEDLYGVDIILCGNDHFYNHLTIWSIQDFINQCNYNKIPFYAHTVEHINTPIYPHNLEIQKNLEKFHLLRQRCWDINDSKEKNRSIARVLLSKNFFQYKKCSEKKDEVIFIGKVYPNRKNLIEILEKQIKVTVIERGNLNYYDFLSKLSEYKYVLSPKSLLVNGIPGRFYEALWVDSIPIQEVYHDTLDFYQIEKKIEGPIFFQTIDELFEQKK